MNLLERPGHIRLPAGNQNATRDDSVCALAAHNLLLFRTLVQLLGRIRDVLGERNGLAHGRDISKGRHHVAFILADCTPRGSSLEFACHTRATVFEANDRIELFDPLQKRIGGRSDTGRVVSLVIGERL